MHKNKNLVLIISFVLVAVIAFYSGTFFGGNKSATKGTGNFANGQFSGVNGTQRGVRAGNGGAVSGVVLSKDANSITVKLRNGGSSIVFYGANSKFMKSVSGSSDDVLVGSNVLVSGTPNSDGSITAESINLNPNIGGFGGMMGSSTRITN